MRAHEQYRADHSNPETLTSLVQSQQLKLVRYLTQRTGNRHDAQDILQDVWVSLLTNNHSTQTNGYLWASAKNRTVDLCKQRVNRTRLDASVMPKTLIEDSGSSTEDTISVRQQLAAVTSVINALPISHSRALLLRVIEGRELKEISEELGVTVRMVQYYLREAHRACRDGAN